MKLHHSFQLCLVDFPDMFSLCSDGFDFIEHAQTHGSFKFIHFGVDAETFDCCRPSNTKVDEQADFFGQFVIVGDDRTTFNCMEQFGGVEAECGDVTVVKDALAFVVDTKRMCTVVDNF